MGGTATGNIFWLDGLPVDAPVGGKAEGLARLRHMGLRVPDAFVIVGATPDALPEGLGAAYERLGGGRVAVRSSAIGEDAADASFAGQYETILGVVGPEALESAVAECLASLTTTRVHAYRESMAGEAAPAQMSVVVQRMVDADSAGVLFTADPITHRRNLVVVDAVPGLGDALVSGTATPDHYVVTRDGGTVRHEAVGDTPVLNDDLLGGLAREALVAEELHGAPLDLEWAIDASGTIWWLQARPITTLGADPQELDTSTGRSHVFTRCNVGEMMPGAVPPLTWSITGRGIDYGMQDTQVWLGVRDQRTDADPTLAMFFGHLFIDLSAYERNSSQTIGSTPDDLCLAVCGRRVPEVTQTPVPPLVQRLPRVVKYVWYVLATRVHVRRMHEVSDHFRIHRGTTAHTTWQHIDNRLEDVWEAYFHHFASSSGSGAIVPVLLRVLSGDEDPTREHQAAVAALLAGAQGVESADVAHGTIDVVAAVRAQPGAAESFGASDPEVALAWLQSPSSGAAGRAFRDYLERHGHRAVRELDLRQLEWRADPLPLVASLQAQFRSTSARSRPLDPEPRSGHGTSTLPDNGRLRAVRRLVPITQAAVRMREETKSLLVKVTVECKQAYRHLARQLVDENRLPDEDAVFFLGHEELGSLARGEADHLGHAAVARRRTFEHQRTLCFPEVFVGVPEPLPPAPPATGSGERAVQGTPVSRGRVTGPARVVQTLDEAFAIREGEILVAPITDVGWTPWFGVVAGLVTEVGSAVSHGAVVAREYGLPAVVNTGNATTVLRTGDLLELDGDTGVVRVVPRTGVEIPP